MQIKQQSELRYPDITDPISHHAAKLCVCPHAQFVVSVGQAFHEGHFGRKLANNGWDIRSWLEG